MSQKKIDYSKSIIYKLCCKDVNIKEIYVGSTTNKKARKWCHRTNCKNANIPSKYNTYVYKFIRENNGFENWDMITIEEYSCNSKNELETRERYWFETLKATLNKKIPIISIEEKKEKRKTKNYDKKYIENNKDKIKETKAKCYQKHRIRILEEQKKKIECEKCGATLSKHCLSQHQKRDICKKNWLCIFSDDD